MSLLQQLQEKETLNIDFHNHLQTGSSFRKEPKTFREKCINLFLEEGFSNLVEVADKVMTSPADMLYITNFGENDGRFEKWTSGEQLNLLVKAGYEVELGEYFIFF